jgi:alkanesulfonate monooxygenase SsuD/methylene tetrahydromethanopterin reductase-like flavin-dependent oxidoreductase (luciferase family)
VPKALRVGIQLPEVERDVRWPEYVAMARAAEEVGFDSVWVGDHYLYRGDGRPERGPWEAWTLLGGLAAVTERIELGPLVACLSFHPPGILAKVAATVDEISGGRLVLGVGAGWNRVEFDAFGIAYERRATAFTDRFDALRRLLAGEHVTAHGAFVDLDDAVVLPPPARVPPLMVGSTGPRVLSASLPFVQVWNTWFDWFGNTPEGFAQKRPLVDDACARAGRDPGEVERSACVLVELDAASRERPRDVAAPPLGGSSERLADGLRAMGEAGADEVILVADPINEGSVRDLGEVIRSLGPKRPEAARRALN